MRSPDLTMLPEAERPMVGRALAKAPRDRWPSCRAFVQALSSAGAAGDRATPIALPPSATGSLSTLVPDTRRHVLTSGLDFQELASRVPAEPEVAEPGPPPAERAVEDDRVAVGTYSQEGMPPIAGQTSVEPSIARSGGEQRAHPRRRISVYVLGVLSPIIIGLLLLASGVFTPRMPKDTTGPNAPTPVHPVATPTETTTATAKPVNPVMETTLPASTADRKTASIAVATKSSTSIPPTSIVCRHKAIDIVDRGAST